MKSTNPRSWSLLVKMPVTMAAVIIGVAATIGIVIAMQYHARLKEALQDRTLLLTQAVAARAPDAVLRHDTWALYQSLKQVAAQAARPDTERILTGMVLDKNGHVLAHLSPMDHPVARPLATKDALDARLLDAALKARAPFTEIHRQGDSGFVEGVVPLFSQSEYLGVVRIRTSTAGLAARTWQATWTILGLTLGLAGIGSLLGAWVSIRMVRPLRALAYGMERVSRNELHTIKPVSILNSDEVGQLAVSFNRMAGELAEKKRLQEQLTASEKLASLGRVTAEFAHEINNPLGGMLNCINTLKKRPDDVDLYRRYLPLLETGLNRIAATAQGLLIELRGTATLTPCALACLSDLRELVAAEARNRDVYVHWDTATRKGACVMCSCPHVQQILLNLAKNGIQAMPNGGLLSVRSRLDAGSMVVEVQDNGIGIPEQHRRHLFDPFFTGRRDGTGLGLWVTYRLIQKMGGSIQVDSTPDRGSLFQVRLPLAPARAAEAHG